MLCSYIQRLMQVLIHSELLPTHTIVLFLVSNQNVQEEMSISRKNNKLNIVTITKHGGHKRQQIRPRSNNFLSLVWNITKHSHWIELAIPKNPIVFVFRFCYILAGK